MNTTQARGITKQNAELPRPFNRGLRLVGNKRNIGSEQMSNDLTGREGTAKRGGRHNEAQLRLDTWEHSG